LTFEHFRHFLHRGKAELDAREREWWAKGEAHVLRLAGTLAYLDWGMRGGPEPSSIEAQFLESAVRLWNEYFWPHSRASIRQIGLSERHTNARRVLRWIKAQSKTEVSVKAIRRDALSQSLDAKQTTALLDSLDQAGWLRKITFNTGGRAAHRWSVNPELLAGAGSAETARSHGHVGQPPLST